MRTFFFFIVLLRALAAILITNSHYAIIYPYNAIASGGLLGDVLFFAISGFCISTHGESFGKWYLRRIARIYVPVWVVTLIYSLLGFYEAHTLREFIAQWIWPTEYHFVGSIMLLYVPMYFISQVKNFGLRKYLLVAGIVFAAQMIWYLLAYDKTYYHIDVVEEPMIRFLFFQSMLLGFYFRRNGIAEKKRSVLGLACGILLILYFVSKVCFSKVSYISDYQILNQIVIFILLGGGILYTGSKEQKLCEWFSGNKRINGVIKFLSDHTLEIYIVQSVLIHQLNIGKFPINMIIVTTAIMLTALLLKKMSQPIVNIINKKLDNEKF